jgi:hypothetical protein
MCEMVILKYDSYVHALISPFELNKWIHALISPF